MSRILFYDWDNQSISYYAVDPRPDRDDSDDPNGSVHRHRLLLQHDPSVGPKVVVANPGEVLSGWVIGVGAEES